MSKNRKIRKAVKEKHSPPLLATDPLAGVDPSPLVWGEDESLESEARRLATGSKANFASRSHDPRFQPSKGVLSERDAAVLLMEKLKEKNQPIIDEREKKALMGLTAFADYLQTAGDYFKEGLEHFDGVSRRYLTSLREFRCSIALEVEGTITASKRFLAFMMDLDQKGALDALTKLVQLGNALKDMFGPEGLVRLTQACLIGAAPATPSPAPGKEEPRVEKQA